MNCKNCECQNETEPNDNKIFVMQAYIPAETDQEPLTITEVIAEIEQQKILNPENIYMIKSINTGIEYGPK
jgi:hypothetical protein